MGFFDKIGSGIGNMKSELEEFMIEEALANLMPKLQKFLPKVKQQVKQFFDKNDCVILIRKEGDDVVVALVKSDEVEIRIKNGVDSFLKTEAGHPMLFSVEQAAELFANGSIQKIIAQHRESKKNENPE